MLVLITHESSGVVREAFRAMGHEAYSCDLLAAQDSSPHHIQADAVAAINSREWDLIGMHPPCTYLCSSGIHWNNRTRGWDHTHAALAHVRSLIEAAGDRRWYLENPVGILSTRWRKPDQVVQPYEFSEDASKRTCLWLNKLPLLVPTRRQSGRFVEHPRGSGKSEDRWQQRSRTYPGIAQAMAHQWGGPVAHLLLEEFDLGGEG